MNRGGGSGGGSSSSGPSLNDRETGFLGSLTDLNKAISPFATDFLGTAKKSTDLNFDFFKSLMDMDPHTMSQVFAPEINMIQKGKQQKIDQLERFAPRGGERDRGLTAARTDAISEISRLYSGARPMAAQGLQNLIGTSTSAGLGTANIGLGTAQSGLDFLGQRRQQSMQQGTQLGLGIGGLVAQLLPLLMSGGKGGSGGGGAVTPGWES